MAAVNQESPVNEFSATSPEFVQSVRRGLQQEQSRREVPENFPTLPLLPAGRYTDPDFLKLELQHLWKKSWLYACHSDQIPVIGDHFRFRQSQAPIIIVRSEKDTIRAFYNTCRHRGAPLVTDDSDQNSKGFTCPYHGWSYDLDGKLVGVRDRRDFPGLDFNCMGLIPVRCESLGNWFFINEDPDAESLRTTLEPVISRLGWFESANIRHIDSRSFNIDCNVKVMLDGFLETYHLKTIHPATVDRFLDHRGTSQHLFKGGHSIMVTPNRNPDGVDPGTIGMKEFPGIDPLFRETNVSFNIFPNLVTPISSTGLPFLTIYPTGDNSMTLESHWFAPDWGEGQPHPLWEKRIDNFVRILEEDLSFVPQIQKSMESAGFKGIQTGYQERRIHYWHEELDRRIGSDNIPRHLRVQPILNEFIES
jgi:choline monooxygenase